MGSASEDIKRACMEELKAVDQEVDQALLDRDDDDVVLADYNSEDDEEGKQKQDKDNDEEENITKVFYFIKIFHFLKKIQNCVVFFTSN